MAGFSVLVFIALPAVIVSLVVALWRFRSTGAKLVVLGAHVALSVLSLALLGAEILPWSIPALGPGLVIAAIRLGTEVLDRSKKTGGKS